MDDKAIRSAKLTLGGMLEKRRAKSAVERAQGQIAPSKYLPGVPRQVHAAGGAVNDARVKFLTGNHPEVPPVVYHGTGSDFHEFRPLSHFGTVDAANQRIGGPSEQHIWGLSPEKTGTVGMGVIPAHISLKNPLDVGTERNWADNPQMIRQAADTMFKSDRLDQDYLKAAEKLYNLSYDRDLLNDRREFDRQAAQTLREAGHDGIIYTNRIEDPGSRSFVTLGPEQVKSTIGNKGTFDPTHPDMTYAEGGAANAEMFQGIHPDLQNAEGKPMDLYHGTPERQEFEAFDDAKLNQRDVGFYGRGHYLTPEVDLAKAYADNYPVAEPGAVIGPLHAALKNPFVWDMSDENKAYRTKKDLETMGIKREGKMNPWDNLRSHEIDTFMKHMRTRGHDGVIVKTPNGEGSNVSEVVVFKPTAIKHAEAEVFDPNDPRIRRAEGGKVDLYSKAAKIISGMKDQPMQAADIVKYAIGKGAKKAELDHVNVPPGKTTPKQVADHIQSMQPQIGVHRREGGDFRFDNSNDYLREMNRLHDRGMHDEAERLYDEFERFEGHGAADKPRYAQYQLPGGQNYREHVLTLDNPQGYQTYTARNHWGKLENPLAHIRMSDRMIGGKKVLHVEEMQSDWNNDARKRGFSTGTEKAEYDAYVAKMRQDMTDAFNGTDASPMIKASLAQKAQTMDPFMLALKLGRDEDHRQAYNRAFSPMQAGVPQAPYINPKKDDWAELAMKHVLTEAAKGNYDGIAFTPDEAQEERWKGTEFKDVYNKKLPGMAQRLVQQHDPETDPDDMTNLQGWAVPMIPLSDKARSGIMQNGFSSFRRGGYVTHVRSAR